MQAVFGLIEDDGVRPVQHSAGDLDIAVSGQGMHVDRIFCGHGDAALIGDPVLVLVGDALALVGIGGGEQGTPALGVDDVAASHARLEIIHDLEVAVVLAGVVTGLLYDVGHQFELGRAHQTHVHAKAGRQQNQALGHADGLEITGSIGPAHGDGLAAGIAFLLDDGHQIGQDLVRMIDVALHVQHRGAAGFGDATQIFVALTPGDLADGDAVEIATENIADFFGGVAMLDLGGAAVDEGRMSAQLGHARLERAAGAGGAEEEHHRQHFVAQISVGNAQSAFLFQIHRHFHNGVDLILRPLLSGDHIHTAHVGLHKNTP